MTDTPQQSFGPLARALHAFDFEHLLPWLGRLPKAAGAVLADWRGRVRGRWQADWRSLALGHRHIGERSLQAYGELAPDADAVQRRAWVRQRFAAEARDEFEARWVAEGRCADLQCRYLPPGTPGILRGHERGQVLLTAHYASFILGIVFLARSGARINAMKSTVTHDPRVARAVSAHFEAKYSGLERHLNGGRLVDIEAGMRPIYRMLERGETVVVLADAPVLPQGARLEVPFVGATRPLAGGAVRIAEKTGSDMGAFICTRSGPRHYTVAVSPIGPASERSTVDAAYDFLSTAILRDPGGWWAADLLPAMPALPRAPAGVPAREDERAAARTADLHCSALVITDSELQGSAELDFGRTELRRRLAAAVPTSRWLEVTRAQATTPAALLKQLAAEAADGGCDRRLLVICQPALLASPTLVSLLNEALHIGRDQAPAKASAVASPAPVCAVAATQHCAGPVPPAYVTRSEFEAYASRRQSLLPATEPWSVALHGAPQAYLLDVAAARVALAGADVTDWAALPAHLATQCVLAPRAYVHDYADYRRHERADMLALLPAGVLRLLDVGGGTGAFARHFAQTRGGEAWVLEPDARAAAEARAHGLHVLECRLEELGAGHDGAFDALTLLDVLEHLEDPRQALTHARRLLRPGGVLLVSTPNVGHWPIVRDLAAGHFDYLPVGSLCWTHLRFFTEASLHMMLQEAGFSIDAVGADTAPTDPGWQRFAEAVASTGAVVDRASLQRQTLRVRARVD